MTIDEIRERLAACPKFDATGQQYIRADYIRDVTFLLAENDRLAAALDKYGEHVIPCPRWSQERETCTCGLDDLRKSL